MKTNFLLIGKELFKAHIKAHQAHTKTGKIINVREHTDMRPEGKSLFDQHAEKEEVNWYNAHSHTQAPFLSKLSAEKAVARLKKQNPNAEHKIVPLPGGNGRVPTWRVDYKHVSKKQTERINTPTFVYTDGKVHQLHDTTHFKNDVFHVFKEHPNKTFTSASDWNVNLFVDTKSPDYYSPGEYSSKVEGIKKKMSEEGALQTAKRLSGSGLLQTMADDKAHEKEMYTGGAKK